MYKNDEVPENKAKLVIEFPKILYKNIIPKVPKKLEAKIIIAL